jgi:hypothetical protein
MADYILSRTRIRIRLTEERWTHITEEHPELDGLRTDVLTAVAEPERIFAGGAGELLAVRELSAGKLLVVVYREEVHDGFIITAFVTGRVRSLFRRAQLWP